MDKLSKRTISPHGLIIMDPNVASNAENSTV